MADNNSNEMYNYLLETYDSVTEENGFYHVVNSSDDKYKCEAYIPVSYNKGDIIDVYTFTPGTHRENGGKVAVRELVQRENTPDCAIFICYDYRLESEENNIIQHAADFAKENNMVIANLGAESFSGGGGNSLQYVAQFVSNPENSQTDVIAVMSESFPEVNFQGTPGVTSWNYKISDDVYQALIDNGVKVYGVSNTHNWQFGSGGRDYYLKMAKRGVDMTFIRTDELDHLGTLESSVENGMVFYLMGISDELGNYAPHNKNGANYQPFVLVDGKFVPLGSIEDYHGIDNKIFLTRDLLDIEEHENIKDFGTERNKTDITFTKSQTPEKYQYLKELSDLSIKIDPSLGLGEGVSSDLDYVVSSMNAIRGLIKNTGFFQGTSKGSFRNDDGIPGCIGAYLDAYYTIMYDLMDRITEQTEAVVSFGQAYVDMDKDLESRQDEYLSDAYTGDIIEQQVPERFTKPYVSPLSYNAVVSEEPLETTETPEINDQKQSGGSTGTKPSGGGSYYGGGSPGGNSSGGTSEVVQPEEAPTPEELNPEGANLIEMERADGSKVSLEMDGEKIKSLKYIYEFETVDEAEKELEIITNKYKEKEEIKEIILNERKVEVVFKEEAYEKLDLETIMEKYFVDELK